MHDVRGDFSTVIVNAIDPDSAASSALLARP
jgi:hypothetical protein